MLRILKTDIRALFRLHIADADIACEILPFRDGRAWSHVRVKCRS
jgi:hypothetical protein